MTFSTEFDFELPKGFIDSEGTLHKNGTMRLATGADEILSKGDIRVQSNPAYLQCVVLSRVITKLGTLPEIYPKTIESIFISDLTYLKMLYERINGNGNLKIPSVCPKCDTKFELDLANPE